MPAFQPYNLLFVVGLTPQIITETIFSFARQRTPMRPEAIHVVTTGYGADFLEASLYGEERHYRGRTIAGAKARWEPFCRDLFGEVLPRPQLHLVRRRGEEAPLDDLRTGADAARAADLIYDRTYQLTREGQPPLVASLTGGRKTMSGDLQTAFSVWARPQDRLVHVLVTPERYESSTFYYPTPETPDAEIHRVEVRVPRLYRLLQDGPLGDLQESPDLQALLAHLEPYNYAEEPTRVRVELGTQARGRSVLRFYGDAGELAWTTLKASDVATLLTLAEALAEQRAASDRQPGEAPRVSSQALLDSARVEARRRAVAALCDQTVRSTWDHPDTISKALSRLRQDDALGELPMALEYLDFESDVTPDATFYRWKTDAPLAIEAVAYVTPALLDEVAWPFDHLPLLTQDDHGTQDDLGAPSAGR